jgi:hypothetical protein
VAPFEFRSGPFSPRVELLARPGRHLIARSAHFPPAHGINPTEFPLIDAEILFRQTEPALSSVRRGHLERRLVPRKTAGKSLVQGSRPASSGVIILTSACSIIQHFCIEPIAEEISWSAAGPIRLPPQKEVCHARRQILPTASKRVSLTRAVDHRSAIESAL